MLLGAEELLGLALLLEGIVVGDGTLDLDLGRLQLEGLGTVGRELQRAVDDEGRARTGGGDLVVVG